MAVRVMMGSMRWLLAVVFALPFPAGGEELRTVGEIRALGPAGMAGKLEARITGVVTSVRGEEYPEFTIQDGTGGVVAHLKGPVGERVKPGQVVEIEGVTDDTPPHPRVRVRNFVVKESAALPEPVKAGVDEMASGALDCMYVEFSGVVRRAKEEESIIPTRIVLDFGPEGRRLAVWVSHYDESLREKLVPDAAVTVRGVCNTWRSASFQPVSTFVVVSDPGTIRIDREAGEVAERSMNDLLTGEADDFRSHREKVRGVVTLAWPDGQVVLQEGESAIRVRAGEATGLRPGDEVEATGFPTRREGRMVLEDAVFSETGKRGEVLPLQVTGRGLEARMKREDLEARLVEMTAVFGGVVREGGAQVALLRDGDLEFRTSLGKGESLPADLEAGDKVEVTGVCGVTWSEKARRFGRTADGFELQLQDGGAIRMTGGKAWWTQGRLVALAGGIFAVLVGSLGWSMVLRKRVGKRSELLVKEIRARHDAELVAAERIRLAGDLHDTLSQSLSAAAMQLEVAALSDGPGEAEEHLVLARRLIDRSREDLRRAVWDLDPAALSGMDLEEALKEVGSEMAGDAEISVTTEGDACALPEGLRMHLFRAGQEAMGNALKHGAPTKLEVKISIGEKEAVLEISDDGCGFDPEDAPGPDDGHFGLRSLRERFARLGGECVISSGPGGTRVRAVVPLENQMEVMR